MRTTRLLPLLLFAASLAGCGNIDLPTKEEPPTDKPTVTEPSDTLDDDDFLTVAEALAAAEGSYAVVCGYIVGYAEGTSLSAATTVFGAVPTTPNTNMLLADSPRETDPQNVFPVSLPTSGSDWRGQLNLCDHPDFLGQAIGVEGVIEPYFRRNGIKRIADAYWLTAFDDEDKLDSDTTATAAADTVRLPLHHTPRVLEGR